MTGRIRELGPLLRGRARQEGLVPALAGLHAALSPRAPHHGPTGFAVAPAELADGGAERTERLPGGEVVVLRGEPGAEPEDWGEAVVWLRLGCSEALRETAVGHLGERVSGGSALLHRQLVRAQLADALTGQLEVRAVLDRPEPRTAADLAHAHDRLSAADRGLARLLGASGYLLGGPGHVADVSALLAAAYAHPEES
ncbi:hypothetical protein GCM10027271_16870 [Saccharopolyspora gloriosae]|uniref:Acyl-CoA dehydrogenase n=1 Tax=Saccharopolyspora gloriosae TaxID=455344 RepID=A0A840NG47_9PSEU|nr:DUF2786 domain-containing protein [Saccharopolyspora gloriosae]MBB5067237.1 hypothetical protein [Saccharopolyspora gloriosae]